MYASWCAERFWFSAPAPQTSWVHRCIFSLTVLISIQYKNIADWRAASPRPERARGPFLVQSFVSLRHLHRQPSSNISLKQFASAIMHDLSISVSWGRSAVGSTICKLKFASWWDKPLSCHASTKHMIFKESVIADNSPQKQLLLCRCCYFESHSVKWRRHVPHRVTQ